MTDRDNSDDDWTCAPTLPAEALEKPEAFQGVYRIEAQGEEATPFPSLIAATAEPPMSPEAEVRGAGGCLAQSTPDHVGWAITRLGALRIEREAYGHDSDTVLAVALAEDLARAS